MTTYDPPKANTEFIFYMSLISQANTKIFQDNPTIAAGDFKIALDGVDQGNLDTLPTVVAGLTSLVKVTVSAAETNGAKFTVIAKDAAGDEWCNWMRDFSTVTNQNDDLATPAQVNAQVDAAIETYHLDHLLAVDYDPASKPGVATALFNELIGNDGGVSQFTANALELAWSAAVRTLTQSAASVTATVTGSDISVKRGDSWSISLTGLGDITGRTKLWFTAKSSYGDTDVLSICQIVETTGLVYINGAAATTAANGVLTVDDESAGDITITLDEAETKNLTKITNALYDIQVLNGGDVTTLTEGYFSITEDVTRAVA